MLLLGGKWGGKCMGMSFLLANFRCECFGLLSVLPGLSCLLSGLLYG